MSDPGHSVKLTIIKTLLWSTGLSREALTEAMSDYVKMDAIGLYDTIKICERFSMLVYLGEGRSSQPHVGAEDHTRAFWTPISGTLHHKSQWLTPHVPPCTLVTLESHASGRQSRSLRHQQNSTPPEISTCERPSHPRVPP
ncbi:hypothetical protein L7F22_046583 [Adiantum nelumboides]|nr:hypothetical protein [Adiantum nelumboides]